MDGIQLLYKLQALLQLTANLKLLTQKFPGRDELMGVLKKYMFYQIDTKASNELVYYLINLEYMPQIEDMFVTWSPIGDYEKCVKIIEHVTKLNNIYEGANIPILTPTQLLLPEGFKVIIFFLKWSELCMLEHLRTLPNIFPHILHRIKPNKDPAQTEIMLKVMKEQVVGINIQIRSMINEFTEKMKRKEIHLLFILQDREDLLVEAGKATAGLNLLKNCNLKYCPANLKTEYFHDFQNYSEIFNEIEKIRSHFMKKENVLVHHKERFKVPDEIEHIVKNADILNLRKYFVGLRKFLENRVEDIPTSSRIYLEESEKAKHLSQILFKLHYQLVTFKSELEKINEDKIFDLIDRFDLLVIPLV